MALYKYVTAERIDVLENELIRFTQPSALNDPWDTRPYVESLLTDEDLERIASPLLQSDNQLIDYVSEIIENFARDYNLGNKSREEIKQAVIEADRQFPGELRELCEAVFSQTLETVKQALPEAVTYVPEALDKAIGVLSLTEKPDHPLMWSHYAANHSGLVLIFDETHDFFKPVRKQSDEIGGLHRVKYSSQRPGFDPLFDMSLIDNEDSESMISWIDKMFFTKSREWEYEKEWRMIKSLRDSVKVIEAQGGNIHLFTLPPSCIQGVILGQKMPAETKAPLIKFVSLDERYRNASLFEARPSSDHFKIELTAIR